MQIGRLLTIINFVLLGLAIAVYLFVPAVATLFLYILLAWMFASIVLFYLPLSHRRIGSGAPPPTTAPMAAAVPAPPAAAAKGRPLPSAPGPMLEPTALGFCIYCGADIPAHVGVCPTCKKPVRAI